MPDLKFIETEALLAELRDRFDDVAIVLVKETTPGSRVTNVSVCTYNDFDMAGRLMQVVHDLTTRNSQEGTNFNPGE